MRSKYNVFVVEDNDDHFDIIRGLLSANQMNVKSLVRAQSSAEADRLLKENNFDVILLDLSLPDSSPMETIDLATAYAPNTAIIVLTSLSEDDLIERALAAGAQDYIDKYSLDSNTLEKSITHAVERKRILCQLAHKNQELERFGSLLAHEIANPVQTMATALWLAQDALPAEANPDIRDAIQLGVKSGEHLRQLISDLLKLTTEDSLERISWVDLNQVATEVIQYCLLLHPSKDYSIEIMGDLPRVVASETIIKQVLQNLLVNAIRYRRDAFLEIKIYGELHDGEHRIFISDNGQGIAREDQEKIFSMFYRHHSSVGKGIGLGFCRRVLEKHGGKLWVESEVGAGSTFCFSLPQKHDEPVLEMT
ncbi:hybrid sensor histidine kinase/response regulator [Cerasicoccus frondis]|uniref:hybrid sensor histidine kinase/response regulator n=1 Tax=Cerasicoccus frondis TaxID=490090 RepID=UPI0028526867|nr:hybrid sensor histidine kinase/response regulator [Cerasicoccus frondis]